MKKDRKGIKVIPSWLVAGWVLFLLVADCAILIFTFTYVRMIGQLELWMAIETIVFCVVLPTICFISIAIRGFYSVVTINEKGVSRALFGVFFKQKITWEEMAGMWAYYRIQPFVFFSKSVDLSGMSYDRIIKQKGVIQVTLNKKVYGAIRRFTDKQIPGIDEETIKHLNLE